MFQEGETPLPNMASLPSAHRQRLMKALPEIYAELKTLSRASGETESSQIWNC